MSAIEGSNSATSLSYLSNEETGKRASDQQEGQNAIIAQTIMSSLSEHMLMASSATSESSVDSMSSEPSSSTTTDTTTTTGDETSSTATDGATTATTASTSSSSGLTPQQKAGFKIGEALEQMASGINSSSCQNQSSQDGKQD
ncbi:MAG: hypothetical protein KFB95_09130 [Simkaniaceae bacterium]|nr:MAG: hypothetical protein KFB95_09130 [Simkaniaceae bacterium]